MYVGGQEEGSDLCRGSGGRRKELTYVGGQEEGADLCRGSRGRS